MRSPSHLVALAWLGCSDPPGSAPDPTCATPEATWDTVGQPVLHTWCTPCHSAHLGAELRSGAPLGVDFDTYEATVPWADRIAARVAPGAASMPPAGDMSPDTARRLLDWIGCGLPGGAPSPLQPCATTRTVASLESCGGGWLHLAGDLTTGDGQDLSCLCSIDGRLEVRGPSTVDLPELTTVTGDVEISDPAVTSFAAPKLVSVATLALRNAPLVDLDLGSLASAEAVSVGGLPQLTSFELPELAHVAGDLVVDTLDVATLVALDRLERVDGDYEVVGGPRLEVVRGSHSTTHIAGDLVWSDLPSLGRGPDDFSELLDLGGDLVLVRLGASTANGWDRLAMVGGDLVVRENPVLVGSVGFPVVTRILGDFVIEDNAALEGWEGMVLLEEVAGDLRIARNGSLQRMPNLAALRVVGGDLIVEDNPALPTVDAMTFAGRLQVGGAVVVVGNAP